MQCTVERKKIQAEVGGFRDVAGHSHLLDTVSFRKFSFYLLALISFLNFDRIYSTDYYNARLF